MAKNDPHYSHGHAHAPVLEDLEASLVELTHLSLLAKQAHWTVQGPLFRPLHQHLDEMAGEYREWQDEVAERMAALGAPPDGRLVTVAECSPLQEIPEGFLAGDDVVEHFATRLEASVIRFRQRMNRLNETEPVSGDLILGILEGLEKQLWMMRAQRS